MKLNLRNMFLFIVGFLVLLSIYQFREVPVSQFWKGWRILYVYSDVLSDKDILTVLEKHGATSVICRSNQKVPVVSQFAPLQVQDSSSYIFRRNDFFTDSLSQAHVFYVPDSQSQSLESCIKELTAFQGTSAGSDGKTSFPYTAPFLCLLLAALLIFFSKNRLLYIFGIFPFLLLAFSRPMFTLCAAVMLFMLGFFIFHSFPGRKDYFKTVMNYPYVPFLSISPVLVMLVSSPLNSLFYVLAALASFCLTGIYFQYKKQKEKSCSFQPVLIRSARMIPIFGRLGFRLMASLIAFLILLLCAFKFLGNMSDFSTSSYQPSLPSPVSSASSELVTLKDFINWTWNTVTFPYRKLGNKVNPIPSEGEVVSINDYQEEGGRIIAQSTPAFVYNSEFRESVYKNIEKLDYPALEKMLLKQGKNSAFAYSKKASSTSSEKYGIILLLIFITIPLVLGIYYILGRKRYGLSI